MRVISGVLKGRSINFLNNLNTRPLKDSVKESIFNILIHSNLINVKIENSNILDLYSGIGSFGIECISRKAKKVTFVEQNKNAVKVLQKNLIKLSIIHKAKISNNKLEDFFENNINEKFDIFFLDPPFKDLSFVKNLELIKKKKYFKKEHLVIVHREKITMDNLENILDIVEVKQYGRSKIIFGFFN